MGKHTKHNPAKLHPPRTVKPSQRCPLCGGVLPEYLCPTCGGIGCMRCEYRNIKPCKCGVK
jgi:hypothetical protein